MARPRSGYYNAIEYIGPRPQKPKKQNFFGGWVIVAIAVVAGIFFGKPLIGGALAAEKGPTDAQAEVNPHFPALRSGPTAVSGATRPKQIPSSQINTFGIACEKVMGKYGLFDQFLSQDESTPLPKPWKYLSEAVGAPKFVAGPGVGFRAQRLSD